MASRYLGLFFCATPFRVAFFVLMALICVSASSPSFFKAKVPVGSEEKAFTVQILFDSLPVFKGDFRPAPASIPGQTVVLKRYSLQASLVAPDTSFFWNTVILAKAGGSGESLLEPVTQNTVRGGLGESEWTRIGFLKSTPQVEFHSPIYGDGAHAFQAGVLTEEMLIPLAVVMMASGPTSVQVRMAAPMWERAYVHRTYAVSGEVTTQKLKIDDVDATLVRFQRDDGAVAEIWLSSQGRRLLLMRSFQGLWMERIQ